MPSRRHRYPDEWRTRLDKITRAQKEDRVAYKSLAEVARRNAAAWHTCAVGAALGLGPNEQAPTPEWDALGAAFYHSVLTSDWSTAKHVLEAIDNAAAAADRQAAADLEAAPAAP